MKSFTGKKLFKLSIAIAFCAISGAVTSYPQTTERRPLFQSITIQPGKPTPNASPTPLVRKTSSTQPIVSEASAPPESLRKTMFPGLAEIDIPGYSGVLIESEDGTVVLDSFSNHAFNPASNVKIATSYAVLRTFGPNFRFRSGIWTDGSIDRSTGSLIGNLYVSGRDPIFNYEHAVSIANELNRLGIARIEGNLVVTSNFVMNYSSSSPRSGSLLLRALSSEKRNSAAKRAWSNYVSNSGKVGIANPDPGVEFTGSSYVQVLPSNAELLFTHESAPLKEIVKATMSYSNNFLSERLGDMIGGAYRVAGVVHRDTGVPSYEYSIETCSGLGINRVTPRAQMTLLRVFKKMLKTHGMTFADVMPVAGMDDGTLKSRFDSDIHLGSVVGKTGTLRQTDRGVSTLSGEINTRRGKFLFVIFNQRGNVWTFRNFQNSFVPLVQSYLGGAVSTKYVPIPMAHRLAKSRVVYPVGSRRRIED